MRASIFEDLGIRLNEGALGALIPSLGAGVSPKLRKVCVMLERGCDEPPVGDAVRGIAMALGKRACEGAQLEELMVQLVRELEDGAWSGRQLSNDPRGGFSHYRSHLRNVSWSIDPESFFALVVGVSSSHSPSLRFHPRIRGRWGNRQT